MTDRLLTAEALAAALLARATAPPRLALTREEAARSLGVSLDSFERHIQPDLKLIRRGRLRLVPVDRARALGSPRTRSGRWGRRRPPYSDSPAASRASAWREVVALSEPRLHSSAPRPCRYSARPERRLASRFPRRARGARLPRSATGIRSRRATLKSATSSRILPVQVQGSTARGSPPRPRQTNLSGTRFRHDPLETVSDGSRIEWGAGIAALQSREPTPRSAAARSPRSPATSPTPKAQRLRGLPRAC